jgi:hypothetical protein
MVICFGASPLLDYEINNLALVIDAAPKSMTLSSNLDHLPIQIPVRARPWTKLA